MKILRQKGGGTKRHSSAEKWISDALAGLSVSEVREMLVITGRLPSIVNAQIAQRRDFEENLLARWAEAFLLLEAVQALSYDAVRSVVGRIGARTKWHSRAGVLLKLQARANRTASEIVALLTTGHADGALTRWRTLHEITVVLLFVGQEDEALAERYLLHERIESFRAAQEYEKHHGLLGFEAIGQRRLAAYEHEYERLSLLFGSGFMKQYGWAQASLRDREHKGPVRFSDLEDAVEESKMRPFY